jgi:hypothetical protein
MSLSVKWFKKRWAEINASGWVVGTFFVAGCESRVQLDQQGLNKTELVKKNWKELF